MRSPATFSKVLVVSGSSVFRELLRVIFEPHSQDVMIADGRIQGRDFLAKFHPVDVVICEVSLPDGNGFELLDDVATIAEGRPEVILVAPRVSESEARRALEKGAAAYLSKPVSYRDITSALRQRLEGAVARAPRRRHCGRACLLGFEGELSFDDSADPQLLWYARDVSTTGAFIETESPLPLGMTLDLALDIGDARIRLRAKVVRVQQPAWGQGAGVGVVFIEFGDSAREVLDAYVGADGAHTY